MTANDTVLDWFPELIRNVLLYVLDCVLRGQSHVQCHAQILFV